MMIDSSQPRGNITPPPLPKKKSRAKVWIIIGASIGALLFISLPVAFIILVSRLVADSDFAENLYYGNPFGTNYEYPTMISPIDNMVMVYVPEGEFYMGSPDGIGYEDEHPMTVFYLNGYWIDQTEVTNGMYAMCVKAGACTQPVMEKSNTRRQYYGNPEFDEYPVIYVGMYQAQAYCSWAGRLLPSEPHWEKAARGYEDYAFPWGFDEPDCSFANFKDCKNDTEKVRSHPDVMGYFGAYDMGGNVSEWTISGYWTYPTTDALIFGSIPSNEGRIFRGGSWASEMDFLRTTTRDVDSPGRTSNDRGFRCMLPVDNGLLYALNWGAGIE